MLLKKIQNRKKELIIRLIAVLFAVTYIVVGNRIACSGLQDLTQSGVTYYEAKVVAVQDRSEETVEISDAQTVQVVTIRFTAELLDGEQKGEHVSAQQQSDPFYAVPLQEVKAGDRILMVPVENGSEEETVVWQYHGHVKTDALIVLAVLFVICLLIFGRGKGFTTLLCLGFTVLAIFVVFVPAILSGQNIYLWTVITSVYIVAVTLLVVYGADRLSATAGIGCVCGVLVSAGMTVLMVKVMNLTGMVDDDSMYLQMLNPVHPIDLKAIIFAAITIGAIGAIMDVSMSVSASLLELKRKAPQLSLPTLFRSGITIGRDMMGTMANTLVLAYIGSSLSLVLLLYAANTSLLTLFNREMIIIEVLQALVGSFGILLTIPLTSLVGSFIYTRDETSFWGIWKRKRKKQIPEHTDVSPVPLEETEQEEKTSPEFPETPEAEKPFSQQRDRDPEYSPEKETDLKDKNASLLETRQRKYHREKNPLKRRWRREYSDVSEEKEITALLSRQDKELVEQAQRQLAASLEQKQKKEQEKERKAAMEKKDPNSRSFFRDVARYYRGFEEKSAQRASQPKEEKENK